ncbi:putative transposase element L1Md-A101/L1Md-A102/L1Md-A2 [Labeo rohita]|uniref:Putative transposase element L1Md-A101/L1Md-A102/L1Md-A2 n=1 Tax=Labeo rohita TaxID=84645 RepID=A0A498L7X6_LABRO|nr:putative transposase element L1Md-A101/L1Md-A102/L1Md-A2 [Labeo rohita]RXN14777.1 putative transposase element L1Md-A101/L1Md-A102/L1Md-A2 [Labeo rohita]
MATSRSKVDTGRGSRNKAPISTDDANRSPRNEGAADNPSGNITCLQMMLDSVKNEICQKIDSLSTDLRSEIVTVRSDVKGWLEPLQQMVESNTSTIKELERSSSDHSDRITELENLISTLNDRLTHFDAKCEDLEGRSRRNNIRLVGLPEGSEGSRPTEYVARLLQEVLQLRDKPLLDRANRTLRDKPKKGQPPRPLVIRVHYFHVRTEILQRAAELSPLNYDGKRLSIFADYTTAVAKKRSAFRDFKRVLHSCPGVRFGLLFPAVLRITTADGVSHKFVEPSVALDFIRKNVKSTETVGNDT